MPLAIALLVVLAALLFIAPAASANLKQCGTVTVPFNTSVKLDTYRVSGSQSCKYVRRAVRAALGKRCEGEVVFDGFRCWHGAAALDAPRASGLTLKRGSSNFQAEVRR